MALWPYSPPIGPPGPGGGDLTNESAAWGRAGDREPSAGRGQLQAAESERSWRQLRPRETQRAESVLEASGESRVETELPDHWARVTHIISDGHAPRPSGQADTIPLLITVTERERHLKRTLNHLYSATVKVARKYENDGVTR